MQTLRLSVEELRQFAQLKESIRGDWKTEEVTIEYVDSKEKMNVRLWQLRLSSPALKDIAALAEQGLSLTDLASALEKVDLSLVSPHDVREVLYAFGPDVLGVIIKNILSSGPTVKDMEQVHAYATARALFFAPLPV